MVVLFLPPSINLSWHFSVSLYPILIYCKSFLAHSFFCLFSQNWQGQKEKFLNEKDKIWTSSYETVQSVNLWKLVFFLSKWTQDFIHTRRCFFYSSKLSTIWILVLCVSTKVSSNLTIIDIKKEDFLSNRFQTLTFFPCCSFLLICCL